MKKNIFICFSIALVLLSCGKSSLKAGSYEGSVESAQIGATIVTIQIDAQGKIVDVEMLLKDSKGNVKDESYGKESGEKTYELAQISLKGAAQYPGKLIETQDIEKVDAISGATVTHKAFQEAVKQALAKAK